MHRKINFQLSYHVLHLHKRTVIEEIKPTIQCNTLENDPIKISYNTVRKIQFDVIH